MNREEVFTVWAPENSAWSPWVAPVLFAQTDWSERIRPEPVTPESPPWLPADLGDTAIIVDLPGPASVEAGFALAARGFRPVPLYNASPGPEEAAGPGFRPASPWNAVVDMGPLVDAIARVTLSLRNLQLSPEAPPAFLLDSVRLSGIRHADPGMFDNRWMVFPQDFPSARFLLSRGIRRAILVQKDRLEPQEDLAHALLRWQEGGIAVLSKKLDDGAAAVAIKVRRPSRYKAAWYRALAQLGLRRSSAGGFGSYIPETTGSG